MTTLTLEGELQLYLNVDTSSSSSNNFVKYVIVVLV